MEFKDVLKMLRKEKKITQEQLAQIVGVSEITIRSYEAGRRTPNFRTMVALEDYFNVSGSYLRGETDVRSPMLASDDPEIMETANKGAPLMLENILFLFDNCDDLSKERFNAFLTEFQITLKTDDKLLRSMILSALSYFLFSLNNLSSAIDNYQEKFPNQFDEKVNKRINYQQEETEKLLLEIVEYLKFKKNK